MISLRRVGREDAARLCAIWSGDRLPGYSLPDDAAQMEALIEEWNRDNGCGRRFYMLLIEADGMPAGLISLFEKEDGASMGISVHPSFQRRGIGAGAVLLAEAFAGGFPWKRLTSECRADNAGSIALHEKCGFCRTGERINRKGNRVICWEKALKDEKEKE